MQAPKGTGLAPHRRFVTITAVVATLASGVALTGLSYAGESTPSTGASSATTDPPVSGTGTGTDPADASALQAFLLACTTFADGAGSADEASPGGASPSPSVDPHQADAGTDPEDPVRTYRSGRTGSDRQRADPTPSNPTGDDRTGDSAGSGQPGDADQPDDAGQQDAGQPDGAGQSQDATQARQSLIDACTAFAALQPGAAGDDDQDRDDQDDDQGGEESPTPGPSPSTIDPSTAGRN
jgi:hypothetical protein